MADEVGPLQAEGLVRGALPELLTELLLTQAEVSRAAAPWLSGDVYAPLAQLEDLGRWVKALQACGQSVVAEAYGVHRETRRRRAAAA